MQTIFSFKTKFQQVSSAEISSLKSNLNWTHWEARLTWTTNLIIITAYSSETHALITSVKVDL